MAKELPYFKFEPNQWENGNIQTVSREDKGLFIDLCSIYWSRIGDLTEKLAIQKLCGGNATALKSLCEENIIEVIDGYICINFLNEQLSIFNDTSKTNSKNAKDGWAKRRNDKASSERNATASNPQCESDAIREEEIREEEIREEGTTMIILEKFSFKNSMLNYGFDSKLVDEWILVRKNKKATNSETAFKAFIKEVEKKDCNLNDLLAEIISRSWSGFKLEWLNESKLANKPKTNLENLARIYNDNSLEERYLKEEQDEANN